MNFSVGSAAADLSAFGEDDLAQRVLGTAPCGGSGCDVPLVRQTPSRMGVGFAASAPLVLLGAWLLLILVLAVSRPRDIDLREATRFVPDVARLLGRLVRDTSLGRGPRVRLLVLFAYLASPIDIVPDFIPVLGYADDVIVVAIALRSVVRHAGAEALHENWSGSAAGLAVVRRLAGLDPNP